MDTAISMRSPTAPFAAKVAAVAPRQSDVHDYGVRHFSAAFKLAEPQRRPAPRSASMPARTLLILGGHNFSGPYSNHSAWPAFDFQLSTVYFLSSRLTTASRPLLLLRRLRHFLMRNLRLQLLILRRQIRILFRQRIDAARQIRVLLL